MKKKKKNKQAENAFIEFNGTSIGHSDLIYSFQWNESLFFLLYTEQLNRLIISNSVSTEPIANQSDEARLQSRYTFRVRM